MFSTIFAGIIAYVSQPATIATIIGFLAGLPALIKTIKTANGANFYDKAMEVAKIEAGKVAYMNLSDEAKFKRVVDAIYAVFPKEAQKYKAIVDEIAFVAYHAFVKPNLDKIKPMNHN